MFKGTKRQQACQRAAFQTPSGLAVSTETLLIEEPVFYSYQDEKHFFDWLEGLKALKAMERTPLGLALSVDSPIDDQSLADLVALLTRYRINRKPLKVFLNTNNQKWFANSRAYWHRAVFKPSTPAAE